jgi:hypothetical protein
LTSLNGTSHLFTFFMFLLCSDMNMLMIFNITWHEDILMLMRVHTTLSLVPGNTSPRRLTCCSTVVVSLAPDCSWCLPTAHKPPPILFGYLVANCKQNGNKKAKKSKKNCCAAHLGSSPVHNDKGWTPQLHQWRVKPWCFVVASANGQLWGRASNMPKMSGWLQATVRESQWHARNEWLAATLWCITCMCG